MERLVRWLTQNIDSQFQASGSYGKIQQKKSLPSHLHLRNSRSSPGANEAILNTGVRGCECHVVLGCPINEACCLPIFIYPFRVPFPALCPMDSNFVCALHFTDSDSRGLGTSQLGIGVSKSRRRNLLLLAGHHSRLGLNPRACTLRH